MCAIDTSTRLPQQEWHPIPLYTNVWQKSAGQDGDNNFPIVAEGGGYPGDYPSGGDTSTVLDVR